MIVVDDLLVELVSRWNREEKRSKVADISQVLFYLDKPFGVECLTSFLSIVRSSSNGVWAVRINVRKSIFIQPLSR